MTVDTFSYIENEGLILIPVIYIIGMILKGFNKISNKYIPIILLFFGMGFSMFLLGINVQSAIQGVLVTGVTVYGNQVIKQLGKDE